MAKTKRKLQREKQNSGDIKKFIKAVGIITVLLLIALFFLFNGL